VRTGLRPPGGPCPGAYNGRAALHLARLFTPCQDPSGAGSLIGEASGEGHLRSKGQRVHGEAADPIPMPAQGPLGVATAPMAPLHAVFPAAYRTLARCPPLRTSAALDAGYGGLGGEGGAILPVFPDGQALVVVRPLVLLAHAIWGADEQAPHTLLLAEGDAFARALVAQSTDLPPFARAHVAAGALEVAPAL
jgi:hypothetical protein